MFYSNGGCANINGATSLSVLPVIYSVINLGHALTLLDEYVR